MPTKFPMKSSILISLLWQDMEVDASVLPKIRCFDSPALCG